MDAEKAARKAAEVAAVSEAALAEARGEHERAKQNALALKAEIEARRADYANAVRREQFPGEAPRTGPLPFGGVTAADMTDEERQMVASLVLLAYLGSDSPQPSCPAPGEALRDATRFRAIRGANSMVVIPPASPPWGRP